MKVNKRKQLYPGLWGRKSNEARRGRRRRLGWGVAHIQAGAPPLPVVVGQVGGMLKMRQKEAQVWDSKAYVNEE